jgi:hypothetical protein
MSPNAASAICPRRVAPQGFFRRSLFPLPTPGVGVPNAIGEQAMQIGKVWIALDEETQAFAIFFARPTGPRKEE